MNNYLNTTNVITHLLNLVKQLNTELRNNGSEILNITNKILTISKILGLKYDMSILTNNQKELYNSWIDARNNKDYEKADILRNKLIEENIL